MTGDRQADFLVKIVVIGDSGVGKTNLMTRFTKNEFHVDSKSTIGVEFARHLVTLPSKKTVLAQVWDTAGQERFRALGPNFYRGAKGSICVFNITDSNSFKNVSTWLSEFEKHGETNALSLLVGNKSDLQQQRAVSTEEAKRFAEKAGVLYMETSAKDATNVTEAFELVLGKITERMDSSTVIASPDHVISPVLSDSSIVLTPTETPVKKKGCCG
jgi:Ras-related protein Rab-11A